MTMRTRDDTEDIHLPGFWTVVAKLAFGLSIPVTFLGVSWAVWMTTEMFGHDKRISILESHSGKAQNQTTSVNVGEASSAAAQPVTTRKIWRTTADVAREEEVAERTVVEWIASGMISPPPTKQGKAWMIAENYRIVPPDAASCGEEGTR